MKIRFLLLTTILFTGCTQIDVQKLNSDIGLHHVCIQDNPQVIVADFVPVVRKGFQRHGITTEIINGQIPSYCTYHLTYVALKTWDMAMYMHHAELDLYEGVTLIAHAEYHLAGGGGLALNKWASVESKMTPVIDKLLADYSPEYVDSYRAEIPKENNTSKLDKLRELKAFYDEGLITEEEYSEEKQLLFKED